MKFKIWSEGNRSIGIPSSGASVEIDDLEECDEDTRIATRGILEEAFKNIFLGLDDDTKVYVIESTEID